MHAYLSLILIPGQLFQKACQKFINAFSLGYSTHTQGGGIWRPSSLPFHLGALGYWFQSIETWLRDARKDQRGEKKKVKSSLDKLQWGKWAFYLLSVLGGCIMTIAAQLHPHQTSPVQGLISPRHLQPGLDFCNDFPYLLLGNQS